MLLSRCTCISRSVFVLIAQRQNLSKYGTTARLLSFTYSVPYMDRIVKKSESCGGVKIGDRTV